MADVLPARAALDGVVVLDLSTVGPASRATRLLADYGASVVKVGPVPGHGPAAVTPPFFAYAGGRGMRRAQVDVRDEDGREAFLRLAAAADVVVESFRPGVVERLGIGFAAVRARNPAIVYVSTSGYGQDGPHAGWAGHDLDYLAVGGYLSSSGPRADGGPPIPGATVADAAAGGMQAALAVMAALLARAATGEGAYLDVSVADGVLSLMALQVDEHLATGAAPGPGHDVLTGRYACYDTYRCADARWVAVGAIETKFFANLCSALGCPEWADRQYEDAAQDGIRTALAAAFATRPRADWIDLLAGADTCVAPALAVAEIPDHAQFRARGAFVQARTAAGAAFAQVGAVLAGMPPVTEPVELPDPEATATDELLVAAGVDRAHVDALRAKGVIA